MIVQARLCFDQTFNSGQTQNIPARRDFLFRPSANSFFEKRVTGKHTKKEFGRTCRGKSGFPSDSQESERHRLLGVIHPFRQESALGRLILLKVANHGARAVIDSEGSIPTKRKFFFREASHGEAYKKRIWSDLRGKSGFPSVPLGGSFFWRQRNIHPFRQNSSLCRSCFSEVANQRARSLVHSE